MAKEKTEKEKKRKPKQRGNGEGSIYKRSDGRWCGAITVGRTPEGKLKKKVIYGKTRNEVAEKMNTELNALSLGNFVDTNNIILKDWMHTWLYEYKKQSVRRTTFQTYEMLIRNFIDPELGHLKLKNLKSTTIQKFYNKLSETKSARTIKLVHIVLHEAFKQAKINNLVIKNVADSEYLSLPKVKKAALKAMSMENQKKFLEAIQSNRLKALFTLTLATGMRRGEVLALKWKNVDLENEIIYVKEALKIVKNFDKNSATKTSVIFEEPKTDAGKRTITIPKKVVDELREHKAIQDKEKEIAGELYNDEDFVFAHKNGKFISLSALRGYYKDILKSIDLEKTTFHALRNTYATRLLEENEHPKVVQVLLGHSNISTTMDIYSEVLPPMKVKAASKINYLFDLENSQKNEKNE